VFDAIVARASISTVIGIFSFKSCCSAPYFA